MNNVRDQVTEAEYWEAGFVEIKFDNSIQHMVHESPYGRSDIFIRYDKENRLHVYAFGAFTMKGVLNAGKEAEVLSGVWRDAIDNQPPGARYEEIVNWIAERVL